jgi:hypothetical protein
MGPEARELALRLRTGRELTRGRPVLAPEPSALQDCRSGRDADRKKGRPDRTPFSSLSAALWGVVPDLARLLPGGLGPPLGRRLRLRGLNAKVVQPGVVRVGDRVGKV